MCRLWADCLNVAYLNFGKQSCDKGVVIIPIVEKMKLNLGKVGYFAKVIQIISDDPGIRSP